MDNDELREELKSIRVDNTAEHNRIYDKLDSLTGKFLSILGGRWLFVLVLGSFAFTASLWAYMIK